MKIDDLSIHRRATSVKRPEMTSEKEISRLKPEFHHMLGLKARNCVGTVTFRNAQRALLAKKKTVAGNSAGSHIFRNFFRYAIFVQRYEGNS